MDDDLVSLVCFLAREVRPSARPAGLRLWSGSEVWRRRRLSDEVTLIAGGAIDPS